MEKEEESQWHINIQLPLFTPHKATKEEIEKQNAEIEHKIRINNLLQNINKLIEESGMILYQNIQMHQWNYPICIDGGENTNINNKTGLFELLYIPEEWNEETILVRGWVYL